QWYPLIDGRRQVERAKASLGHPPEMTPTKKGWATIVAICVLLLVCSTLFRPFLPEVVSVGWHALHGNAVQFGAWEIPVPWGWRGLSVKDTLVVGKIQEQGSGDYQTSDVIIGNLKLAVGAAIDRKNWKKVSEDNLKPDYQFSSENDVQMDGETGFCFTFVGIDHSERLWIDCVFPIHRLSIQ